MSQTLLYLCTLCFLFCIASCGSGNDSSSVGRPNQTTIGSGVLSVTPGGDLSQRLAVSPQITASTRHACALKSSGELWCWGSNNVGQLGSPGDIAGPARVMALGPVRDVAVGAGVTCVCDVTGVTWCWGFQGYNDGPRGGAPSREVADALSRPRRKQVPACEAVVAGSLYACSLSRDGEVHCWGQLMEAMPPEAGPSIERPQSVVGHRVAPGWHGDPLRIDGLADIREISGGYRHACAINREGAAFCWGNDRGGQTSIGPRSGDVISVPIEGALSIAAGYDHTLASTRRDTLWWGVDPVGDCINESAPGSVANVDLAGCRQAPTASHVFPEPLAMLRSGFRQTCGLRGDRMVCWGRPHGVAFGTAASMARAPTVEAEDVQAFDLSTGGGCLLDLAERAWCWGQLAYAAERRPAQDVSETIPRLAVPPGRLVMSAVPNR